MLSKCQNVKVAGLKAFKKCLIFWSDLVKISDVQPNWEGVATGLDMLFSSRQIIAITKLLNMVYNLQYTDFQINIATSYYELRIYLNFADIQI